MAPLAPMPSELLRYKWEIRQRWVVPALLGATCLCVSTALFVTASLSIVREAMFVYSFCGLMILLVGGIMSLVLAATERRHVAAYETPLSLDQLEEMSYLTAQHPVLKPFVAAALAPGRIPVQADLDRCWKYCEQSKYVFIDRTALSDLQKAASEVRRRILESESNSGG